MYAVCMYAYMYVTPCHHATASSPSVYEMARTASNDTIPMNWGKYMKREEAPKCNKEYSTKFDTSGTRSLEDSFFGAIDDTSIPSSMRLIFDKFLAEMNAYLDDHPIIEYCSTSDVLYNTNVGVAVKAQQLVINLFGPILPGISGEDLAGTRTLFLCCVLNNIV